MLWMLRYLWRLLVPEDNPKYEKILKQQARRLSNLTGCKLNQAQRTIAIDFYGHKSLKDLKVQIESGNVSSDILNLLSFDSSNQSLISLQRHWSRIDTAFDAIEYLQAFDRNSVLACILNLQEDEFKKLVKGA